MTPNSADPGHQPETEFIGEVQAFSGPALSPDDPSLEPRDRLGRPADAANRSAVEKKDTPDKE